MISYASVWLSILHIELDIVFDCADGQTRHPAEAITLFLTITQSANRNSSLNAAVNTPSPTIMESPAAAATSVPPLSRTGDPPIESDTPVQPTAESQTETSRTALGRAEEAINDINTMKTWQKAVTNIKWVMDTVTPIAAVCPISFCLSVAELTSTLQLNPYAKLAWSLLSKIPEVHLIAFLDDVELLLNLFFPSCHQTLLQQVERDLNIETLLQAIRDVFEFTEEADALRNIMPESRLATIPEEMLECVSKCAEFIRSYAEDVQVGTSVSSISLAIINM